MRSKIAVVVELAASLLVADQIVTVRDGVVYPVGILEQTRIANPTNSSEWIVGDGSVQRVVYPGAWYVLEMEVVGLSFPVSSFSGQLANESQLSVSWSDEMQKWFIDYYDQYGGDDLQPCNWNAWTNFNYLSESISLTLFPDGPSSSTRTLEFRGSSTVSEVDRVVYRSDFDRLTASFVDASIIDGLASVAFVQSATTGLARASQLSSLTNGMARLVDVQSATSGLVRASVTNGLVGQAYVAAATNDLVRRYLITSNAWITADFTNRTIAVSLVSSNGVTNVVSVGASNSIDPEATNLLWLALSSGLSTKAPLAWGQYAPSGASNPDPSYMTLLDAPATVFASGCAFDTYGTYAVLTTPGTVAFSTGSNGVCRIGPNSTNYFGYSTGNSVLVGAVPDSFVTYGAGTTNGYAEITYEYTGGDFPTLWFTPSLAVDFEIVTSAEWIDNLDGTATAFAAAHSATGFFKASTTTTIGYVFETSMPARFLGGVIGSTNALPVRYDSTISISSGGHTYRIPAQLEE